MMKKYEITIEGVIEAKVNTSFYFLASSSKEALRMLNSEISSEIIKGNLLDNYDNLTKDEFNVKVEPHRRIRLIGE